MTKLRSRLRQQSVPGMTLSKRNDLLIAATSFCNAFASKQPLDDIFGFMSYSEDVAAFEHGLPQLAPFLGREFRGQQGIREYFRLISSCLTYENMSFSNYVIDAEENKVSVRGNARFTWISTSQSWTEVFTYVLEFDDDVKVKRYEIWADTGAAYLASKGQLN